MPIEQEYFDSDVKAGKIRQQLVTIHYHKCQAALGAAPHFSLRRNFRKANMVDVHYLVAPGTDTGPNSEYG